MFPGIIAHRPVRPGADPLPSDLPAMDNIQFWFAADHLIYSDEAATTAAKNGDPVAVWGNNGANAQNATQPVLESRPIFRTGGAGGRPYLELPEGEGRFFQDLAMDYPSGVSNFGGWQAVAAVVDCPVSGGRSFLMGAPYSSYTKADLYIEPSNQTVRWGKGEWAQGGIDNTKPDHFLLSHNAACDNRSSVNATTYTRINNCTNAGSSGGASTSFLRKPGVGFFTGRIYEMIVWRYTFFGGGEHATIANYFKNKYGL
ncbi:tail-related protein [Citromicrobium phage vB_CbaS-RXM]|nr:tail-related protein [Citromicrobium phage vB_CbaS-RXM]